VWGIKTYMRKYKMENMNLRDININISLNLRATYTALQCFLRTHCHETIINIVLSRDSIATNLFTNRWGGACVSHVPSVIRYPFYYDTWSVLLSGMTEFFCSPTSVIRRTRRIDIDRITLKTSYESNRRDYWWV